MSIATLKRKTQAKYNNMSVGTKNFSLNGSLRNQGFVGQTMLSRSLPRSLMNGNTLRGHGGNNGSYKIAPVVQSAVTSLNDTHVIKHSVVNTMAMIDNRYTLYYLKNITVKPDNTMNANSQGEYIENVAKTEISNANDCHVKGGLTTKGCCAKNNMYPRKSMYSFTKPKSDYLPISEGEYIRKFNGKCAVNNTDFVANNLRKDPLPRPPAAY